MGDRLPIDRLHFVRPPMSPLVETTLALVQDCVRTRYRESGLSWQDFVSGPADTALTRADMESAEQRILASGHRFAWSASISAAERPEAYKPRDGGDAGDAGFSHPDAPTEPADESGKALCGVGDNVVRHDKDVVGVARFIRTNDRVLTYLGSGVPPGTIAVIDDSGGTLTAPIIDQFSGVICAGGTVRSHLGILTREYNIPCLMNARITGIADGDMVMFEATAQAKSAEDYQQGIDRFGRIWKLPQDGGQ